MPTRHRVSHSSRNATAGLSSSSGHLHPVSDSSQFPSMNSSFIRSSDLSIPVPIMEHPNQSEVTIRVDQTLPHRFSASVMDGLANCTCCCPSRHHVPDDSQAPLLGDNAAEEERELTEEEERHSDDVERSNTETVNCMRRRLNYFFMSPREKFHAKRRVPCKLFTQLLKVVVVTVQLIIFGSTRAAHVDFGEQSRLSFTHMFLRNWDSQYETLNYPPSIGPFAVYEKCDFYLAIGNVISKFNQTPEIGVGAYSFDSDDPIVTICHTNMSDALLETNHVALTEERYCADIQPRRIFQSLGNVAAVEQLLAEHNISINFIHLLKLEMEFSLLSPIISQLGWMHDLECFRFQVRVRMEKTTQTGMIHISLVAPFTAMPCENLSDPEVVPSDHPSIAVQPHTTGSRRETTSLTHKLQQFWRRILLEDQNHHTAKPTTVIHSYTVRRIFIVLLHTVAFILGFCSLVLCVRSLVRGFMTWKETVQFFRNWFSIELSGHFWEFVHPWFIVIIVNDLMIIAGSLCMLWTFNGLHHPLDSLSFVFGPSALLVWSGVLRYIGYSYTNSLLMRTIAKSIPALLRFGVCSLMLFFAFSLCGWVVLGPYNLKFRTFVTTLECLFSLLNGDDMFVTFSVIDDRKPWGIFIFSRIFLYIFITLFIYVVLNLFITIIFEAYEEVKERRDSNGRPQDSPLFAFIRQPCDDHLQSSCYFKPEHNSHSGRRFLPVHTLAYTPAHCVNLSNVASHRSSTSQAYISNVAVVSPPTPREAPNPEVVIQGVYTSRSSEGNPTPNRPSSSSASIVSQTSSASDTVGGARPMPLSSESGNDNREDSCGTLIPTETQVPVDSNSESPVA